MSAPYPNSISDSIDSTLMGIHSGLPPFMLAKNQISFAINITHRGGRPKTRPAIRKLSISYESDDTKTNATEAMFQVAGAYEGYGIAGDCLLTSIGGRFFRWLITNNTAAVSDLSGGLAHLNNPTQNQAWYFYGEGFGIINDGLDYPLIYDGAALRRSAGPPGRELPVGCMGTYNNGRLVMALPNRRSYIAGDLVYNTNSGTAKYNYRDSILKINDNVDILNGQPFGVPINAGPINALFAVAIPDTSLGQGPLHIGARNGIFGVDLPLDATLWTTTAQPTQIVSLPRNGPVSATGVTAVNSDAWYRGINGIFSLQVGRRDMNTWVNTPLSYEMQRVLPFDTQILLDHCSAVEFDNRLIMTCSPFTVKDRGVAHRGFVALDFNNISSLTSRSQPAYDGLWTGLNVLQILTADINGESRCFIFALDADNKIALYELLKDHQSNFDFNGTEDVLIESSIESNALFGLDSYPPQVRNRLKKMITGEIFAEDLSGNNMPVQVQYRSDMHPFWVDWKIITLCAPPCAQPDTCQQPEPIQNQFAFYKRLPEPKDDCSTLTQRLLRTGYWFQVRLKWAGHIELNRFTLWANPIDETVSVACGSDECKVLKGCTESMFTYSIE